jgi:hypothetical protein
MPTAIKRSKISARSGYSPALVRAAKSELLQEQTPLRADFFSSYIDEFIQPPDDSILKQKGGGRIGFYEAVRQDGQVITCFEQLFSEIFSREIEVIPGGEAAIDKKAAEDLEQQLKAIGFDDICKKMAWGKFWGFSVGEAIYSIDNGKVTLKTIKTRRRNRFHFNYSGEIRWKAPVSMTWGVPLTPQKYWVFQCGNDNDDDPNGRALAYWLYWPTFFKRSSMRWWILFLETFAKPHPHGTYPPGADEEVIAALEDALEQFGQQDHTVSPEGTVISLIEASRSGKAEYGGLVDLMNAEITKIILGQTMTTENGSSRSQAEVHENTKAAIAKALSDLLCQSFNDSIGAWLTQWNFPGAAIPKIWRKFESPVDLKAEADKDTVLSALGIKLKTDAIGGKYGDEYEIPEEEESLTQLNGEQVNALVSIVSNAQQGGWKPDLVAGLIAGAFPSWPDSAITAITKNLGSEGGDQPGQAPPPVDPAKAADLLDKAQFSKEPDDPLLPIAEALLARLSTVEFRGVPTAKETKKKKCKDTSHSCGRSCISGKKTCRINATVEAQAKIAQLKKELAEAKAKPAEPKLEAGFVGEIDTSQIKADPKRFQYKLIGEHTKTGEVGSLSGVQTYDPNLAGVVQVWRDPKDQGLYVINGHNRLALANRAGAEKVTARIIDAPDAAHARAIGALTNIAEGRGTGLDAAKFFRDTGLTEADLRAKGIPMREQIAQKGLAIAKLEPSLFAKVVNGDLSEARAAIIGEAGLKPEQQRDLHTLAERKGKKLNDGTLAELVAGVKASSSQQVEQFDLFGASAVAQSNAIERAGLAAGIRSQLGRDKKLFGVVARSKAAAELERGGNKIDRDASKAIADQSAQTMGVFDQLKNSSGPIAKALNAAALRVAGGEKQATVQKELYGQIAEIIKGGKY